MEIKDCPCVEGKRDEEYIKCPFYGSEKCPGNPHKCILYTIYENSVSARVVMASVDTSLRVVREAEIAE
jgi:hypothetical protein